MDVPWDDQLNLKSSALPINPHADATRFNLMMGCPTNVIEGAMPWRVSKISIFRNKCLKSIKLFSIAILSRRVVLMLDSDYSL